jgi:hemolysin D
MGIRADAFMDLLRRYGAVFRHAWRHRKELDPPQRRSHEAEFLPAALALQETPAHPAPRIAMWLILTFALIALLWAVVGRVDVVATAVGKIIPNDRTKIIQPLEAAVVKAIYVGDGQPVRAGELLVELDATAAQADSERIRNDLITARLAAARASAMLAAMETEMPPVLPAVDGANAERHAAEQRLLQGQYAELDANVAQLDAEIARRQAELRATVELVEKLKQVLPIVREKAENYKQLLAENFASRHDYLQHEQARIEVERDLGAQQEKQTELRAALLEAQRQKARLLAETRRVQLDQLREAEQQVATLTQEYVKAEQRNRLMRLSAPVDGTVQQLAVHTVGGVVTPAQPLMIIVPKDNALEVEAFLQNKDIGFVNPGQAAQVKIETFTFTKYGTIDGEVQHVSSDAIQDEQLGLVYAARVKLARSTMAVEDKVVKLTPGMAVTVEIKTGKRRLIEYFLSPLLRYKDESLRER